MPSWRVVCVAAAAALTGCAVVAFRWRTRGSLCRCASRCLVGKTIVVTGANVGIGKATALELCRRGATVVMACRDLTKGATAAADICRAVPTARLSLRKLDLASFKSVAGFVRELDSRGDRVDVLVNNAGVYHCPFALTDDQLEYQMGVNFFGPFLLTELLLVSRAAGPPSRVVSVTSSLARHGSLDLDNVNSERTYNRKLAYRNSKLALNLWMRDLGERVTGVGMFCVSPGMVNTELGRHVINGTWLYPVARLFAALFLKTPEAGAQTVVHCTVAGAVPTAGLYFRNCKNQPWPDNTDDPGAVARLRAVAFATVGDYLACRD